MSSAPRIDRLERNAIINGGFDFWQRGGVSSAVNLSTTPSYVAPDRFRVSYSGTVTGTPTTAVSTTVPDLASKRSCKVSLRRNGTTATIRLEQRIESNDVFDIVRAGEASFSAKFFATGVSGVTARLTLNVPTVVDDYTSVTQIHQSTQTSVPSSTWTTASFEAVTIPGSAALGLAVVWELLLPSATDGAAVDYLVSQIMAHAGPNISAFSRNGRNIGEEGSACARFFQSSYPNDVAPGTSGHSASGIRSRVLPSSNDFEGQTVFFPVRFRATPTKTVYNDDTGTANQVRNVSVAETYTENGTHIAATHFSLHYSGGTLSSTHIIAFHWSAQAEL